MTQFVPGLFQTADYARAVTRPGHKSAPEAEIERRVADATRPTGSARQTAAAAGTRSTTWRSPTSSAARP